MDIQQYIEMFKEFPLIKAAEERKMLLVIRTPPEGVDPEAATWELTPEQQATRAEFIYRNIRLAIHEAKKFCAVDDARMIDFICGAVEGMIYALDKFDVSRNLRFSTYAVWWIKARIRSEIKTSDTKAVRFKTLDQAFKRQRNQYLRDGKLWTEEQIFADLDWPVSKIQKFQQDQIRLRVSLDTIDFSKDDFEVYDTALYVEDPKESVLERLHQAEQVDLMTESFKVLTANERLVINCYYGLSGEKRTYDQLTVETGIPREKLRKLERNALKKMWRYMKIKKPSLCD